MIDDSPDLAAKLDPKKFSVGNTSDLDAKSEDAQKGVDAIQFDWSKVKDLLGALQAQEADPNSSNSLAQGQNLTAGATTRMGQEGLGEAADDPVSLGKALMKLGSKGSAGQAAAVGQAQGQQQMQAAQMATALKQQQAQARIDMYKKELALEDQKFQMSRGIKQGTDGLELANLALKNMYNAQVNRARNAKELGDIQASRDNFNQVMGYIQAGIGAASQATAAAAKAMAPSAEDQNLADTYNAESSQRYNNSLNNISNNFQTMSNASQSQPSALPAVKSFYDQTEAP